MDQVTAKEEAYNVVQVIANVDCQRCMSARGLSNDGREEESGIITDEFWGPEGQHVKYIN